MLKLPIGLALAAILSGCATALPEITSGRKDPTNPYERVPVARAPATFAGYQHFLPVGPKDWKELNRRVTPGGSR